jgi:hypothetical protein
MLPTSAPGGRVVTAPWRGVAHAACVSLWHGDPAVTGGRDSSDGTASGKAGR